MSGNFLYVYEEMLRQNLDAQYQIHALFKSNISARRNFIDKFRFPYLLGKADYIFVDDFHPLLYKVNFRKAKKSYKYGMQWVHLRRLVIVEQVKGRSFL